MFAWVGVLWVPGDVGIYASNLLRSARWAAYRRPIRRACMAHDEAWLEPCAGFGVFLWQASRVSPDDFPAGRLHNLIIAPKRSGDRGRNASTISAGPRPGVPLDTSRLEQASVSAADRSSSAVWEQASARSLASASASGMGAVAGAGGGYRCGGAGGGKR